MVRRVATVSALALVLAVCVAASACDDVRRRLGGSAVASPSQAPADHRGVPAASTSAQSVEGLAADAHRVPPAGYRTLTVGGVAPTPRGNAVMLTDAERDVGVPIFVGGTEALSIALRLQKRRYSRPLTHDLLDDVVTRLHGRIVAVRVDKLERSIFHGSVLVESGGRLSVVDARPSDAIALALGNGVPIHVAESVIVAAGVSLDGIELGPPERLREPSGDDAGGGGVAL